jgi:uncharacterized protein YcnI
MKYIMVFLVVSLLFGVSAAQAHVGVRPSDIKGGQLHTFTLGVSSEKLVATTSVRLVVPAGLTHTLPNVKSGWKIATKKEGESVVEITWTGVIPAEQRDDFVFSAQVSKDAKELVWKVYQTYADKSVVAWDQEAGETPFSKTTVTNDIVVPEEPKKETGQQQSPTALIISIVALAISIVGVLKRRAEDNTFTGNL